LKTKVGHLDEENRKMQSQLKELELELEERKHKIEEL